MMKIARRSLGSDYNCGFGWADDCFVQCGGSERRGFFFEAFPNNPDTMVRGDSAISIEDAEKKAWDKFLKHTNCKLDHSNPDNFDRKGYENGVGFCKECNLFIGDMFEPVNKCCKCGVPTYYSPDINNDWWCNECSLNMPEELMTDSLKFIRNYKNEKEISKEEFEQGLKEVMEHITKDPITS
jgi:hypothetical protein